MIFVEKALYNTLAASTALTALVGGTASPRIYNTVIPQGATLPVVVFQKMGGRHIADNPKEAADLNYAVKCIDDDLITAEEVDLQIKNTLDRQSLGVNTEGMADYKVFRQLNLHFIEDIGGGKPLYHIGAIYVIGVAEEQT